MAGRRGRSGRKPTPNELKEARGTLRPDRENPDAPVYERASAEMPPPDWLPPYAKQVWRRTAKLMADSRVLRACDRETLAGYCLAFSTMRDAQREIAATGLVIDDGGTRRRNPAAVVLSTQLAQLRQYAAELGITPTTRTGVHVAAQRIDEPETEAGQAKKRRLALVSKFLAKRK